MPPRPLTTRDEWIEAGLAALAAGGPDGVRIEVVAQAIGVTKGGFYGQFADRAAFLEELLDAWERRSVEDVLAQVEADRGSAQDRILRAGTLTFSDELLPVDLAVRAWSRSSSTVEARLRRVDNRRLQYLRDQFATFVAKPEEVEARATLTFALAIGRHFMAAEHGDRSSSDAVAYLLRSS